MDVARQHLDADIERADRTAKMLAHLADAIEHGPDRQRGGETYQEEAIDALKHGSTLARKERCNLIHVALIYDEKVSTPVPPVPDRNATEDARGAS